MAKEYFLAYFDYLDSNSELSDAEVGRLFKAALKYGQSGEAPKLCGNEKFAFGFIKKQIDRDNEKYEQKCAANKENILKRWQNTDSKPNDTSEYDRNSSYTKNTKEKDKTKEKKNTKTNIKESIAKAIPKKKLGEFKNVLLTEQEFEKLNTDYKPDLLGIIEHLSAYIEMKGYKAKSHYLAIKKWVALAYQEQKLRESIFENRKNQNFGGITNAGITRTNYAEGEICTEFSDGDEPPEGLYD